MTTPTMRNAPLADENDASYDAMVAVHSRRSSSLKTYSKRVRENHNTTANKRQRVETAQLWNSASQALSPKQDSKLRRGKDPSSIYSPPTRQKNFLTTTIPRDRSASPTSSSPTKSNLSFSYKERRVLSQSRQASSSENGGLSLNSRQSVPTSNLPHTSTQPYTPSPSQPKYSSQFSLASGSLSPESKSSKASLATDISNSNPFHPALSRDPLANISPRSINKLPNLPGTDYSSLSQEKENNIKHSHDLSKASVSDSSRVSRLSTTGSSSTASRHLTKPILSRKPVGTVTFSKGSTNPSALNSKRKQPIDTSNSLKHGIPTKRKNPTIESYFKPLTQPPSSPNSYLGSSDSLDPPSTPPTSPPQPESSPFQFPTLTKKTRRRLTTKPVLPSLDTMSASRGNEPSQPIEIPAKKNPVNETEYYQTQLALGQRARFTTCRECEYRYDMSLKTERESHYQVHENLIPTEALREHPEIKVWQDSIDGIIHTVLRIRRQSPQSMKGMAEIEFQRSREDCGSPPFNAQKLWSQIPDPAGDGTRKVDRYNMYIYAIGNEPVGYLLAERVTVGWASSGQYMYCDVEDGIPTGILHNVLLSVDRIWVRESHRKKGIATTLVNAARNSFIPSMILGKKDVAVSPLLEKGVAFFKAYFSGVFPGYDYLIHTSDD